VASVSAVVSASKYGHGTPNGNLPGYRPVAPVRFASPRSAPAGRRRGSAAPGPRRPGRPFPRPTSPWPQDGSRTGRRPWRSCGTPATTSRRTSGCGGWSSPTCPRRCPARSAGSSSGVVSATPRTPARSWRGNGATTSSRNCAADGIGRSAAADEGRSVGAVHRAVARCRPGTLAPSRDSRAAGDDDRATLLRREVDHGSFTARGLRPSR
jgi:hypothetical protein